MDRLSESNEQLDRAQPKFLQAIQAIKSKIAERILSIANFETADEIEKIIAEIVTFIEAIKTLLSAKEDLSLALRRAEDSLHRLGNDSSHLPPQARDVFKQAIKRAGMQQWQIAEELGIIPSTFCVFLSGKRSVGRCHFAIADLLGKALFLKLQTLSVDGNREDITIEIANVLAKKCKPSAESSRNADAPEA